MIKIVLCGLIACLHSNLIALEKPILPQDIVIDSRQELTKQQLFFKNVKLYQDTSKLFSYDAEEYLTYATSGYNWAKRNGNESEQLNSKFYYLRYLFDCGKYTVAIPIAYNLIDSTNFIEDKRAIKVTSYIKKMYLNIPAYDKLLEFYPKYYKVNLKHGRDVSKSDYINDRYLGYAYYKNKNFTEAIKHFKSLATKLSKDDNHYGLANTYNDIGLSYKNLNNWDSALFYFDKGLVELKNLNYPFFKSIISSNKADYFLTTGEYKKAIPYYEEELRLSKLNKDKYIKSTAFYNLAYVSYFDADFKSSLNRIDSAIFYNSKNTEYSAKYLHLKGKILSGIGQVKLAEQSFQRSDFLNDSMEQVRIQSNYVLATTQYGLARSESDLAISKQNVQVEKDKNKAQFIGLILLGTLVVGLFLFYKKVKKDKSIIALQKIEAEETSKEKSILLKEVHHRVKNNLQVISSLLDLQASKLKDENFSLMVEDAQKHIHSMSLVHQMLYQTDVLSRINLKKYLTQLSNFISSGQLNENITVNIESRDIEASIDKAIPLGLIVTELMTNSYKHAWSNQEEGQIEIKLSVNDEMVNFVYSDNGKGLPENFDPKKQKSLGFRLLRMLSEEMAAKFTTESKSNFEFKMNFKES